MPEQNLSAFAAMRALRDQLRARLDQNEDYRAWKALDEALRQLEPSTMPRAVDLALNAMSDLAVSETGTLPKLPNVDGDDVLLNFRSRA
jgi:spore coat polysaccharide biosynthesis protein SpsF (cytidylyltransferase family)